MTMEMDNHDLAFLWRLKRPSFSRRADNGCQTGFRGCERQRAVEIGRDHHASRSADDRLLEPRRPQLKAADDLSGDLLQTQVAELFGGGMTNLGERCSLRDVYTVVT